MKAALIRIYGVNQTSKLMHNIKIHRKLLLLFK